VLPQSRHRLHSGRVCRHGGQDSARCKKIIEGKIDPSFVVTHPASLEDAPEMYKKFRDKKDGVIKVVMRPGQ
jgi:threonine dehydrogenase-like Zn-dependent dehydrogenase